MNNCNDYCNNFGCNQDCLQGRSCPARITKEQMGEPFIGSNLDMFLAVVVWVFVASCIGYAWGGWR